VVMFHTGLDSIRILKPTEALMLLEWLNQHQEDLYKTAKEEKVN
jgi:Trm5-related predicted tRNA methylase